MYVQAIFSPKLHTYIHIYTCTSFPHPVFINFDYETKMKITIIFFHFRSMILKKTVVCSWHFKMEDYRWSAVFEWEEVEWQGESSTMSNPLDRISIRQEFHESDISDGEEEPMDIEPQKSVGNKDKINHEETLQLKLTEINGNSGKPLKD